MNQELTMTMCDELLRACVLTPRDYVFSQSNHQHVTVVTDDDVLPRTYLNTWALSQTLSIEELCETKRYWGTLSKEQLFEKATTGKMMYREYVALCLEYGYYPDGRAADVGLDIINHWVRNLRPITYFLTADEKKKTIIANYQKMVQDRIAWRLTDVENHAILNRIEQLEREIEQLRSQTLGGTVEAAIM